MATQVVKVRRDTLVGCMTCPLCNKLLKEATTISECLHTFCRKCIYDKLNDEELDCCPICNIDLGCTPVEKLRPDHNLQDVRAKIFPFKRRKAKAPEVAAVSLPIRRKERSLSSLVVSTPRVPTQTGLTGRRTKAVARKAAAPRGSSFTIEDPVKKEEDVVEDQLESSSSPETLNKIAQNKRQNPSTAEPSNHSSNKDTDNGGELVPGKIDLWKPLNCLVEAANRTKSYKFTIQGGSVTKTEQPHAPNTEVHVPKKKAREHVHKSKVQGDKNGSIPAPSEQLVKARRLHKISRKRRAASGVLGGSAQALLNASGIRPDRKILPIWFSLVASDEQEGDVRLPQISACYLRIKDGSVPVSFIQKYLAKKLDLTGEAEVEIRFQGQPVLPTLALHDLVDTWLRATSTSQKLVASVGTSAKDFMMVLTYARKLPQP